MSESDGPGGLALFLFASGPAAGFFVYSAIQKKYRNKDARYVPEKVVSYTITNEVVNDEFEQKTTSRDRKLSGHNEHEPHVRANYSKAYKD